MHCRFISGATVLLTDMMLFNYFYFYVFILHRLNDGYVIHSQHINKYRNIY